MFKPSFRNLCIVFAVWGAVGFVLGTEILMGPSRWVAEFCRNNSEYTAWEQPLVRTLIVLLVGASLAASIFIASHLINTTRRHVRALIVLALLTSLSMTLYFWMNPDKFNPPKFVKKENQERFVVGPYPDAEQMKQLKGQGFTGVVSLLHPAVVPFETKLIAEENVNAKAAGIEMIHLPMLPWISENKESLDKLALLVSSNTNRYYLHCYLGKDRVNVALKMIEKSGATANRDMARKARQLTDRIKLARGKIYFLENGLYLSGFPTDEEFLAYIVASGISNVVSVMEAEDEGAARWLERERSVLELHQVKFHHMPIEKDPYDPVEAVRVMSAILKMERPVYVHDFKSPSVGIQALIQAYSKRVPCIPPMLVDSNMLVGKVECLAPNIVAGPRPADLKQFVQLEKCGIRSYAYFGGTNDAVAVRDQEFTTAGKFDWRCISGQDDSADDVFSADGPWYVYGNYDRADLAATFGPAYVEPAAYVGEPAEAALVLADASVARAVKYEMLISRIKANDDGSFMERCRSFCVNAVPDVRLIILLGPFCLFYAYICAGYAGWLKISRGVRTPYTRKIFHFLIFTMASVMQIIAGTSAVMLFGSVVACCVMYAILRGDGFAFYEAMARPSDAPKRTMFILIPLMTTALGGVISNIFFQPVAAIGYLVGGWGDAIGEPVGSKWGKHKYSVPSMLGVPATRSIEGSAAVILAGFLAALMGLLFMGAPVMMAVSIALICAVACAIVEAFSTHGMDNLTVQVAAAAIVFYLLRSSLM